MSNHNNGAVGAQINRPSSSASSSSTTSKTKRRGKQDVATGQASWISSVVNLVNTIVGAGILAMPQAMSHMGILLGVFIIGWAGLTAGFGLYLQTRCARYLDRGTSSFFALSQITYPKASIIFDGAIAIKCFGVAVSYLIIIGNLMPGVAQGFNSHIPDSSFLLDRHFWVTAFMLIVIPFAFLRRLDSLKYTSIIALISIAYLVVLVVAHFIMGDTKAERGPIRGVGTAGAVSVLSSFPVIVFAYTCHQNMFSILNEMKDNSPFKTTSVVGFSIGSAFSMYTLVAITGYLSFGNNVSDNIVSMYAPSVASTIGKASIVVLVMFSYALQVHPCRASVDAVLRWRPNPRSSHPARTSSLSPSPSRSTPLLAPTKAPTTDAMGEVRFAVITTIIIILSYIVAMTVASLSKVLAYVGSTGSTSISFILPGLFYYKISAPDSPHQQRLFKADDDEEGPAESSGADASDNEEGAGLLSASASRLGAAAGPAWKKQLLRRLSLALAIYGLVVMVTCLVTNTVFLAGSGH